MKWLIIVFGLILLFIFFESKKNSEIKFEKGNSNPETVVKKVPANRQSETDTKKNTGKEFQTSPNQSNVKTDTLKYLNKCIVNEY